MRARKSVDQIGTKRVEGGETITRIYSVKKKLFSIKKKVVLRLESLDLSKYQARDRWSVKS